MWQVISLKNPLYFIILNLIGFIFFYIMAKSIYRERHLRIALLDSFALLLCYFVKFFDISFFIVAAVPVAAAVMIFFEKKENRFKLTVSLICPLLMMLLMSVAGGITLMTVLGSNYDAYYSQLRVYEDYSFSLIILALLSSTGALFFSSLVKIFNKKLKKINMQKYILLLWSPISNLVFSILIIFILSYYFPVFTDMTWMTYIIGGFIIFTCVMNFAIFLFLDKIEQVEILNKQYEEDIIKNKLDYQEAVLADKSKTKLRRIRHDLCNILLTVKSLISLGEYEEATEMLNKTVNDFSSVDGIMLSSNSTLNALLSIKKEQAEKNGAALKIDISEIAPIKTDIYDICRVVGNLIDNAIEGVKNAEVKTIEFSVLSDIDTVTVMTENQYDSSEIKKRQTNRGNGKSIIKDIVKKYNGKSVFNAQNGQYVTKIILANSD